MHGSPEDFDRIQHRGAQNVAKAAQEVGAKLIHFSAIGADINSDIPYFKTKGLGEEAVLAENPKSTIVRPSLVFGPGDGFFSVCDWPSHTFVGLDADSNRNLLPCHRSCHSSQSSLEVPPNSSLFMLETWPALSRSYPVKTLLYGVSLMGKQSKQEVQMVATNPTDLTRTSLTFHIFHSSADILRNDADRAQMQEQIPTHLVSAVRHWDSSRFPHGEAARKHLHVVSGPTQTTQVEQRRHVTQPFVRGPRGGTRRQETCFGS
jgi:hypothetical protein